MVTFGQPLNQNSAKCTFTKKYKDGIFKQWSKLSARIFGQKFWFSLETGAFLSFWTQYADTLVQRVMEKCFYQSLWLFTPIIYIGSKCG